MLIGQAGTTVQVKLERIVEPLIESGRSSGVVHYVQILGL